MLHAPAGIRRSLSVIVALFAVVVAPAGRAEDASTRFSASAAGAEQFGPNPNLACPRSIAADVLGSELKKLAEKSKKPEARLDGRLCAIAQSLLAWDPAKGETPPAPIRAFLSSHFGLPLPARSATVQMVELGETGDERKSSTTEEGKVLADRLRPSMSAMLLEYQQPRWGIVTQRVRKGLVKVAVVMDDRILELDPLPRKLSPGQNAPLSGKVLPPYRDPKIAVSDTHGQIVSPPPTPGDAFQGELRCGSTPGDLWVEVRAERDGQSSVVAAFSVACGKDLPTSVALSTKPWPADTAAQERRLAEGINAQREAAGIAPVEWDDRVAGVARSVAETLRDQLARGEAPAVDLGPMLAKAGVSSALVLQNPAQAQSAEDAEQRFTASPTNRQNLLSPEVNRVGVGIAPTKETGGKASVLVVELFTKVL
ncbi:MAG TPA: CAP domain-containing protein, partial [Anaeromyxobacter sp.]|nr:CAP domain-containing protein [Anaeromyxobacter sp.]